ncbi:MAG: hypothetical protein AB7J30_12640 [Hyphomicrobium sp.]|uniref:hypothetical protein n=1 Tax=Hyphomicrobium sp. TaxID=82 RepID=UPI003D12FC1F
MRRLLVRLPKTDGSAPIAEALAYFAWTAWPGRDERKHRDKLWLGGMDVIAKALEIPLAERPEQLRYRKPSKFEGKMNRAWQIVWGDRWDAVLLALWQVRSDEEMPRYPLSQADAVRQILDWRQPDEAMLVDDPDVEHRRRLAAGLIGDSEEARRARADTERAEYAAADAWLAREGDRDSREHNIKTRIWRAGLPAVPLAYGFFAAVGLFQKAPAPSIAGVLRDPSWVVPAVQHAAGFADELERRLDPPEVLIPVLRD